MASTIAAPRVAQRRGGGAQCGVARRFRHAAPARRGAARGGGGMAEPVGGWLGLDMHLRSVPIFIALPARSGALRASGNPRFPRRCAARATPRARRPASSNTASRAIMALRRDGGSSSMVVDSGGCCPAQLDRMRRAGAIASLGLAGLLLAGAARAADRWFITSDGVRLHYIEAGRGRTIVMVPGWTMPAWIFDAQIARFLAPLTASWRSTRARRATARSRRAATTRGGAARTSPNCSTGSGRDPVLLIGWSLGVLDSLAYVHEHGDAPRRRPRAGGQFGRRGPARPAPAPARRIRRGAARRPRRAR